MLVQDLRKTLDEWGFIIKKTSKFSDSDRGVYKKLVEFCNALKNVGIEEIPMDKYREIAQHSSLIFSETPPPIEEDKENPQLYRIDLLNYLAKNRKEFFKPGHRIFGAFKTYILRANELEFNSKFSPSPAFDNESLNIHEEQLKDDLYTFVTGEIGYSIGTMTRTIFDDVIESRWKNYINTVRELVNNEAQEGYIKDIISSDSNFNTLLNALKEINWKTCKDGMLSFVRCFNVLKALAGNHSDDCFWVMYGAIGGEGKSVYTNGELSYFIQKNLSVYVGDNKCFGEHFNSPEPFQSKLLYIREDESWSPEQIRFKKQLVDHDYIGIEQKGKDAYRITPQCLITSMTNYRSYDISRRFAIINYGRNTIGVDVPSLEDFESIKKFSKVSENIYQNLFSQKEMPYVKKVCVLLCKAVQHLNKREDRQWAFNVAVKILQTSILEKDPDLANLDSPDFFRLDNILRKSLNRYKRNQDENKIMSNEFYKNNVEEALRVLISRKELSEDVFIGTTNDYNALVGAPEAKQKHTAIIMRNKSSVWKAIDNYFRMNTKNVDRFSEEEQFDKYAKFLYDAINDKSILEYSIEEIAAIIECKYKLS